MLFRKEIDPGLEILKLPPITGNVLLICPDFFLIMAAGQEFILEI